MSILPSQPSERTKLNIWYKLIELADVLSAQFSFDSLIIKVIELFDNLSGLSTKIWLDPMLFDPTIHAKLLDTQLLVEHILPVMEKAFHERRILSSESSQDAAFPGNHLTLVIPLTVKDQLLGVVQIEKSDNLSIDDTTFQSCVAITMQFSIALYYLKNLTQIQYHQRFIEFSNKTSEIGKSILTNLDQSSLYNNLVTLLHQQFRYQKVCLYLIHDDQHRTLRRIGMMDNEISTDDNYSFKQDDHPVGWSISHESPIIINNFIPGQVFSSVQELADIQAECVMPLFEGESLIGALEISDKRADIFGPETLIGLYKLAEIIAVAIRNASVFHTEQVKWKISERLQDVAGLLTTEVSFENIQQRVLSELAAFLPYDSAAIWLFDNEEELDAEHLTWSLRLGAFKVNESVNLELDENSFIKLNLLLDTYYERTYGEEELLSIYPWIQQILNSSFPLIRDDPSIAEPLGDVLGLDGDYSALGTLIGTEDQRFGLLILADHQADRYDLDSQNVLNNYANTALVILNNAKLYFAAHNQAWTSTVLLQVAETTQSISDLDELLNTISRMLPSLLGVDACAIFLWDSSIETFFSDASSGFSVEQTELLRDFTVLPGTVPAFDSLLHDLKPTVINEEALSIEVAKQYFTNYDFVTSLVVLFPLVSQNGLCGALLIDFTNSDLNLNSSQKVWDDKYMLIEGANRQIAAAIENLQLIKFQEEEAYISIALLQVAQAIVSNNELNEILSSIVRITPILVGVKRCIIYLWDNNGLVFRQSVYYGFSKPELKMLGEVIKGDEFPFIEVIQQGMQILYHPLRSDADPATWNEISVDETRVVETIASNSDGDISIKLDGKYLLHTEKLLIGFPLSVKGEILGVMLIEEEDQVRRASSSHIREKRIEIVQGITQQAAIAIKNELLQQEAVKSERMEQELQLAREIQSTFLPKRLPQPPGWEINARWQPARQVAGDFYDVLTLDDGRIGIVIADVADKGMPAALFMTLIRTLIRAAAKEQSSPAEVLRQVNELLVPDSKNSMFVTVFYGIVSLDSGQFIYANAGHNPPVIKRTDQDELIELPPTGIVLGVFDDIQVGEKEEKIYPGDWVLLYTDGITEAFSPSDEMFGTTRLYDLIRYYKFSTASELIDRIENTVFDFIKGTEISDDMTLTVIYRKSL
jgi:phosphoserine phosphatase RsbU/P